MIVSANLCFVLLQGTIRCPFSWSIKKRIHKDGTWRLLLITDCKGAWDCYWDEARHSSRSRKQRARRVFFSQKTRKLFPLEIYVLCWTYWTIQLSPCRRYWYCSLMIPWWGKPWLEGRIIPKRIPWSFERGIRIEVQILRKWSNISGTVQPKFESLKFNTLRSNVKKF